MSYFNDFALKERRESPGSLRGTIEKYPPTERRGALRGTPLTATRPTDAHSPFEGRLWDTHESGLNDFFSQEDEGLLIDRDHVAGFVSHRFSKEFPPRPTSTPLKWELVRLELVSLRRFGRPMVYATNRELPRMDQLEKMPTREPSAFESASLDSLAKGEELVYVQQPHNMLALGALRAKQIAPSATTSSGERCGSLLVRVSGQRDAPRGRSAREAADLTPVCFLAPLPLRYGRREPVPLGQRGLAMPAV